MRLNYQVTISQNKKKWANEKIKDVIKIPIVLNLV